MGSRKFLLIPAVIAKMGDATWVGMPSTHFAITSSTVDKDGAVVVCHLVLAAHDVPQRIDGGLIVGLLQLVDVGRFSVGVVVPMLHHGLDEHRHDDVLGFIVLDECNGLYM